MDHGAHDGIDATQVGSWRDVADQRGAVGSGGQGEADDTGFVRRGGGGGEFDGSCAEQRRQMAADCLFDVGGCMRRGECSSEVAELPFAVTGRVAGQTSFERPPVGRSGDVACLTEFLELLSANVARVGELQRSGDAPAIDRDRRTQGDAHIVISGAARERGVAVHDRRTVGQGDRVRRPDAVGHRVVRVDALRRAPVAGVGALDHHQRRAVVWIDDAEPSPRRTEDRVREIESGSHRLLGGIDPCQEL